MGVMTDRNQILQRALSLPPEDRSFVVDGLEQSLTGGEFASAEIAAAWTAEIERRVVAYDRGDVPASEVDMSLVRMRDYLAEHRARRAKS
jgi:hypothetical protein